jgi:hypothetical protein
MAAAAAFAMPRRRQSTTQPPTSTDTRGRRTSKRKRRSRVGKRLQLTLIRKYVQYARQFQRLPDRIATEQLLLQGHDEFYLGGGDLGEPRLSYAAFMKLVRNRRCEFSRLRAQHGARRCVCLRPTLPRLVSPLLAPDFGWIIAMRWRSVDSGGSSTANESGDALSTRPTLDEEQQEIRALIEELDRVRRRVAPARAPTDYNPLDGAMNETTISEAEQQQRHSGQGHAGDEGHLQMLSVEPDSLSLVGGAETDHSVMDGELSTAEGYGSASAIMSTGGWDVVVSRDKLVSMLRAAQETLRVQKKLLEDVRAIEHRLAGFR